MLRIVSIVPSGPSARVLTRPCGPPSPSGLTARQFDGSEGRGLSHPLLGGVAAGRGGFPQARSRRRTHPAALRHPSKEGMCFGPADKLLLLFRFFAGPPQVPCGGRSGKSGRALREMSRGKKGRTPSRRGLLRWCLLWWCATLRPPTGQDKTGRRPRAGRGRARFWVRQQTPLRLAQAKPDAPCPGEKTLQPAPGPTKIRQKTPQSYHLIRDNRGELVYGTSCWLAIHQISSANADRGKP